MGAGRSRFECNKRIMKSRTPLPLLRFHLQALNPLEKSPDSQQTASLPEHEHLDFLRDRLSQPV
jgi:hypothetical protein